MDSNGNHSGRLPDSDHSARFRRIPLECPWNWKPEWLRLQPTEFRRNPADSDIPLGIRRIPPELMGDGKDLREVGENKGLWTSKQLADLQDKRNALHRLIQTWHEVQLVYTPHVATLILQTQPPPKATNTAPYASLPSEVLAENLPLFLPSSLPRSIRALPELKDICNLERRLREPQADDALAEIRRQRRVIQGLWLFKRLNVSGTGNRPNM
jgi:hypothetical protein